MRKKQKEQSQNTKSKAAQRHHLAFRMNVLFFSIFLLFSILIFRLGYIQIVKGEEYVRELQRKEEVRVNTSVPRGKIYDRYGRILVDNQPEKAITYTKMQTTKQADMIEIAKELANLIEMPTDKVTERDTLDFWILMNPEKAKEKVSQEEIQKFREENPEITEKEVNTEYDRRIRERITEAELATLTNYDMEVLAIFNKMRTGYNLSPQIVKGENVTDAEFARVSERLSDLTGVNTITDWKRVRHSSLSILGRTTVPAKGIPKTMLNYYLARDYSRNDRVGESYFEAQYEELLQGEKAVEKNVTNKQGQVIETVTTFEGEPGKDLVTTIDSRLQAETDRILESKLLNLKSLGGSDLVDRGFIVVMDPNTGELLSVSGKKIEYDDTGKRYIIDYSYGSFTTSYEAGSAVKAATVLMGYSNNVIKPGSVLLDSPMRIGNITLRSLFNQSGSVMVNDQTALERSSNIYMFKIAMMIGGRSNVSGSRFSLENGTLQKIRNGFAEFGLGVNTGIDLPGETAGFQADPDTQVKILNMAIGQFDTYTPMQLAQYISAVANGGYRIQPRMLKEIRKPSADGQLMGGLEDETEPIILNRISNSKAEIDHVKEGLRRVYYGGNGTAAYKFRDLEPTAAGKTGTAQVVYYGPKRERYGTHTVNFVHTGFAPYDNPEIAYAVIFPWATTNVTKHLSHANEAARETIEAYFKLKSEYEIQGLTDNTVDRKILPSAGEEVLNEDVEEKVVQE